MAPQDVRDPIRHVIDGHGIVVGLAVLGPAFGQRCRAMVRRPGSQRVDLGRVLETLAGPFERPGFRYAAAISNARACETATMSSSDSGDVLDLDRDVPTTAEDVAVLNRFRYGQRLTTASEPSRLWMNDLETEDLFEVIEVPVIVK